MGAIGLGFFKRRRVWSSVGAVVVAAGAVALLTHQDHLKPEEFLGALGWDTKPDSLLIFPETGAGTPRLPRSAPDRRTGLLNMLRSDLFSTSALLIPGGQDPGSIPLIFVHGLMSTPSMWEGVVRSIVADEDLRHRYQFWFFYYPTGQPIPISALQLRECLDEAAGRERLSQPAILVGHSMGGIVSRTQAVTFEADDAERILHGVSALPDDQMVRRALIFDARPDIGRLVFIATPHRGTDFAYRRISLLGHHLIRLPYWMEAEISDFQESLPKLGRRSFPTSIAGLSPASAFLRELNGAPLAAPSHSIIPVAGDPDDPFANDGIVPLSSARVPVAASELILTGDHGSFDAPETLAELRRILRKHANLPPSSPPP